MPGTTRRTFRFNGGVRDWISSGGWSPNSGMSKKKTDLSLYSIEEYADALVHDALRLANSAFESASGISHYPGEERRCAWQFISYYYAGYFAANALMRLSGYSCTNLSALDCAEINQQASLYGVGGVDDANKISPGVYFSELSQTGSPKLHLTLISAKGGVHIQFWVGFLKFLLALEKSIKSSASPKPDRVNALSELSSLMAGLKHSGSQNGAWLSEVRNAINYRFEYGVWYPYENCATTGIVGKNAMSRTIAGSDSLPNSQQNLSDPERAIRISAFLISWLKASLSTLETTSSGSKKDLITKGALAMAADI